MTTKTWIPEELYQQILKLMPRTCVDLVLKYKDEVLVLKRRIAPLKDFWALPGGMIYKGETLTGAAKRVAYEELGLDVDADAFKFSNVANFQDDLYGRHDICLTYLLNLQDKPEIKINYQHRELMWLPLKDLYELGESIDMKVLMQIEEVFERSI
jgi:colanic acid biosynthesis protein WcaH